VSWRKEDSGNSRARTALPKYTSAMNIYFTSVGMFKTTLYNQGNLSGTKKINIFVCTYDYRPSRRNLLFDIWLACS
jgi:hypothetical protein